MELREKVYHALVRKDERVQKEYEDYVRNHLEEHRKKPMKHWKTLGKLNWHYRIQKKEEPLLSREEIGEPRENAAAKRGTKPKEKPKEKPREKLPYLKGAESRAYPWISPADFLRKLMAYDVISFDIFDTLLFRPFEKPQDLFYLEGDRLNMLRFYNLRRDAEVEARNRKERACGFREITLEDIYAYIEEQTGLPAKKGIALELELEKKFLKANPYMKYVFDTLLANKKRVLLVSDMYIPKKELADLLKNCGYEGYEKLFVSCEYQVSKREGGLYREVLDYLGEGFGTMIHVGDNLVSDIEKPGEYGIDTHYYQNVNQAGKPYRADEIPGLIGSAYRGIANQRLHCGYVRYDAYYEFGFLYGGLFALGYASFIHELALKKGIQEILFVARDGYVLKKVYDSLYSEIPTDYLLCSRISNLKMTAYRDKAGFLKEFVYRFLHEKKQITIEEVLKNMEGESLIEACRDFMDIGQNLKEENVSLFLEFLETHWGELRNIYEEKCMLSREYYRKFFEGRKRALIVDIGWRGQGILALRDLEEDFWHFGCEITGVLAGCAPTQENLGQLTTGVMTAYLFSPVKNIECYRFHSRRSINNILTELLVGAPSPSFKGFKQGKDGYELEFDVPETRNYELIHKVHTGIFDFVKMYTEAFQDMPYMLEISGRDAYMPIRHILKNYGFLKRFFRNYEFQDTVGGTGGKNSKTVKDIFQKFGL